MCSKKSGSPPQVRGKPELFDGMTDEERITPAGAGKTVQLRKREQFLLDHPRRCGENTAKCSNIIISGRITPAGAGKTLQRLVRRVAERDHPRRCGENLLGLQQIRRHQGSPPQVRGKRHCNIGYDILPRITPAGAGKTCQKLISRSSM